MIKNDLVQKIAEEYALSRNLSAKITQTLLDELVSGLIKDSRVELRRFGVFGTKKQKPRVITLPTGKNIKLPAQNVVTFAPSPTLKKQINPKRRKSRK